MYKGMSIGIDGRPLQGKVTGMGRYVIELCRELDTLLPNAKFFIYSQYPIELPVLSERWVTRVESSRVGAYLKSAIWLKTYAGLMCQKDRLDYFWASATLLPRLPIGVRTICTVYDLNHLIVPDTMAVPTLWSSKLFFKRDVLMADAVTSISDGTSKRLLERLGIKTDAVVRPAASSLYCRQDLAAVHNVLLSYDVNTPYLLSVATWEPRKNLELLITTFKKMKADGHIPFHKLVLVGGNGWKDEKLRSLISGDISGDVVPLGYVPEHDLPALYAGSDVFVFPSIYEGFGMPVLEAQFCGAQVVTTDIPELREAGGPGSVYITPDEQGIRNGILLALSKLNEHRDVLLEVPFSSWRDGAHKLAQLFTK
jgi:glycosyltransferase involved in cell wall biosynthesis